jgi:hypothetical protein
VARLPCYETEAHTLLDHLQEAGIVLAERGSLASSVVADQDEAERLLDAYLSREGETSPVSPRSASERSDSDSR